MTNERRPTTTRIARGGYVRGRAEYLDGARVRYLWPCGHTEVTDHAAGPVPKRIGPAAMTFLVDYWTRTGGVWLPPCRTCARRARPRREDA